jgi:hypothetical protein
VAKKYAAIHFGFTATGKVRRALLDTAKASGIDAMDLRYVEENGSRKIVDVTSGETVRRLP